MYKGVEINHLVRESKVNNITFQNPLWFLFEYRRAPLMPSVITPFSLKRIPYKLQKNEKNVSTLFTHTHSLILLKQASSVLSHSLLFLNHYFTTPSNTSWQYSRPTRPHRQWAIPCAFCFHIVRVEIVYHATTSWLRLLDLAKLWGKMSKSYQKAIKKEIKYLLNW